MILVLYIVHRFILFDHSNGYAGSLHRDSRALRALQIATELPMHRAHQRLDLERDAVLQST